MGVISISWINSQGGSGTISNSPWIISDITLYNGNHNVITITAVDAAGNSGTDDLTVDVKPDKPEGFQIGFQSP